MGLTAERVAQHYGIAREQADEFALASHQKALAAQAAGKFDEEIVPVPVTFTVPTRKSKPRTESNFKVDEGPRADTSLEALAQAEAGLPRQGHRHRGQLLADLGRCRGRGGDVGRTRAGRWASRRWRASWPTPMPDACPRRWASGRCTPFPKALKLAGLTLDQIDLIELNEAFAAQSLAVIKTLGLDLGAGQRQWRRHRAGASAGLHRREAHRQPAAGIEAARRRSTAW